MADKKTVQSEHVHCANCIKLKEESCLEIKKSLQECAQANEDARIEKEQAVQKELKEAKSKITKLQKTLSAFQLATTIGVTILGQDAFNRIFNKVEEVQKVQEKITNIAPEKKETEASITPEKETDKKITSVSSSKSNNFKKLLDEMAQKDKINEAKLVITKDQTDNELLVTDAIQPLTPSVIPSIVDPPVIPFSGYSGYKLKYIFDLPVQPTPDLIVQTIGQPNLEFFGDGPGVFVYTQSDPVPSPSSVSVMALIPLTYKRRTD